MPYGFVPRYLDARTLAPHNTGSFRAALRAEIVQWGEGSA